MVTRKNGTPTLRSSEGVNCGAVYSGATKARLMWLPVTSPENTAITPPTSSAATTAKRGYSALHSSQAASMPPHSRRWSSRVAKACRPKRSKIPASMAAASEWGIIFISRAKRPVSPHSTIRPFAKINTPTAWFNVTPCNPLTSSAAPGVDQAVRIGTLRHSVRASVLTPIPRAVIQPAI